MSAAHNAIENSNKMLIPIYYWSDRHLFQIDEYTNNGNWWKRKYHVRPELPRYTQEQVLVLFAPSES